jgi:6,7-dimethyl-8-ribityllumazine synthase
MAEAISGKLDAAPHRFALVAARWNESITARLIEAATETILRHGGKADAITTVHVPGSYEIALAARRLAESGRFAAIICLGCILRGQTPHFDHLAADVIRSISQASQATGVPMTFGVILAESLSQAVDRAGGSHGNKGTEAALAAIEMADLLSTLPR